MRVSRHFQLALVAMALASVASAADNTSNPWAGHWKMDPAQSKLTGDVMRFTSGADGEMSLVENGHASMFKLDGQPHKTWSGAEATWRKVDDNTYEEHVKRGDVDLADVTWTLSNNGKALKIESKGTHPDGSSFDDVEEATRVSGTKGLAGSWRGTKQELNETQTYAIADGGPNALDWDIPAIKGKLHATLDGKDNAPEGPTVPQGLTVAVTKASPRVLKVTEKMNGELLQHSTMTLSPDGNKITEVIMPAKGTPMTEVWIKQ